MTKPVALVVAMDPGNGIGKDGGIPWRLSKDLQYFKKVTTAAQPGMQNAVIMGRKTWESLPVKFRPLAARLNVVVSSTTSDFGEGVEVAKSVTEAVEKMQEREGIENVFVIGGNRAYAEALTLPSCSHLYITRVAKAHECDTFFPKVDPAVWQAVAISPTQSTGDIPFDYVKYARAQETGVEMESRGHEEYQYIQLAHQVLKNAGSPLVVGAQHRYNLRQSFPLSTTQPQDFSAIAARVLQLISGGQSAAVNEAPEAQANGPPEAFHLRHYGARYAGPGVDYTGQGVDQLGEVITAIRDNPSDRRIIFSLWNPAELQSVPDAPSSVFCQFNVNQQENSLSCFLYQRECDLADGVAQSVATYALLTCLIAKVCGRVPGELIHEIGAPFVGRESLEQALSSVPQPYPVLKILGDRQGIRDFQLGDFQLVGYNVYRQ
mmetsp:Transcript_87743/g.200535  ORF Transcript_87743/g.200535 Transcript_87743/m.200535 type:complete len:434 (+) Transcript_87743:46-1347(+)